MTAQKSVRITIEEDDNKLLDKLQQQRKESEEKIVINALFCEKQWCDKQLIKTKAKDHYWLWHRPRQCDKCSKYLWADDELFTCEKYHFFGSDICIDCSKEFIVNVPNDNCSNDEKKPIEPLTKESIKLNDIESQQIEQKPSPTLPETVLSPKLCPVTPDNDSPTAKNKEIDAFNFRFCGRPNCDKQLIKVLCKDFYYTFNRWRECEVCRKTMRGNDEMWVCPASHWINYDLCVDCEQFVDVEKNGQKGTKEEKKTEKKSEPVEAVSLV